MRKVNCIFSKVFCRFGSCINYVDSISLAYHHFFSVARKLITFDVRHDGLNLYISISYRQTFKLGSTVNYSLHEK